VTRAPLYHCNVGLRQQPQHLGCLLSHILRPRVTGDLKCDAAIERRQTGCKALLAGDVDDVFADIKGRFGQFLDCWIAWDNQRPLEFEHQRAGGYERDDVVTFVDPGPERGGNLGRRRRDRAQIALFQLRHAATARVKHLSLHPIAREHGAGGLADAGIVVVDEAGRIQDGPAPVSWRVAIDPGRRAP
jgi:hypothetical protein